MKKFKKRTKMINPETGRLVFEEIIQNTFKKYRDNIVCSDDIIQKIKDDIAQQIRTQLKLI